MGVSSQLWEATNACGDGAMQGSITVPDGAIVGNIHAQDTIGDNVKRLASMKDSSLVTQ